MRGVRTLPHSALPLPRLATVALAAALLVGASAAGAEVLEVEGEVVDARSRWTPSKRTIVTDATVRTDRGELVTVTQLGGSVDGIGMWVSHHPRPLQGGERVRATAEVVAGRASGAGALLLRRLAPPSLAASSLDSEYAVYGAIRARDAAGCAADPATCREKPLHWGSGCVQIWLDAAGTSTIPGDRELEVVEEAFASWSFELSATCQDVSLVPTRTLGVAVGEDALNVVVFRDDRWCRPGDGGAPETCYDPVALAVTTLFFVSSPDSPDFGRIVEAEIEINTSGQHFVVDDSSLGLDLRTTVAHEIGHLLGLGHNCWNGSDDWPRDLANRMVPDCRMIPEGFETARATMFHLQEEGDRRGRLHSDDITGGCAVTRGLDCEWEVRSRFPAPWSGCAAAGGDAGSRPAAAAALALAFALALAPIRLRRSRARARACATAPRSRAAPGWGRTGAAARPGAPGSRSGAARGSAR